MKKKRAVKVWCKHIKWDTYGENPMWWCRLNLTFNLLIEEKGVNYCCFCGAKRPLAKRKEGR